jgi:hypothetical protein
MQRNQRCVAYARSKLVAPRLRVGGLRGICTTMLCGACSNAPPQTPCGGDEHPFATLKYRIFGHPRFLLRGVGGAQTEISLATIAYNLKRMINVLGATNLSRTLATVS